MPRDPFIDALVAEIDQALVALQAARRIVADLQRSSQAIERARAREVVVRRPSVAPSLRYSGMTVAEAAGTLHVSEEHVRRLLRRGELTGVAFGGRVGWRLPRDAVQQVAQLWEEQRRGSESARRGAPPTRRRGQRRR